MQRGGRAADQPAMVPERGPAHGPGQHRRARLRGSVRRGHRDRSRTIHAGLSELAGKHPGLVYQPAVVVGTPDSGLVLRRLWRICRAHRRPHGVRSLWQRGHRTGKRRSRYVVQQRVVAPLHAGMAGRGLRRPDGILSQLGHGDRLRHPVLLGGPHDYAGHRKHRADTFPLRVSARHGAGRGRPEDEQDPGQHLGPAGPAGTVRDRCPAFRPDDGNRSGE